MAIFEIQGPDGNIIEVEGKAPPNPSQIAEIFSAAGVQEKPPQTFQNYPKSAPGSGTSSWTSGDETLSRVSQNYMRPALEMGGMMVGGSAGTAAGPMGTVGGAALGYTGGSLIADTIEEATGLKAPDANFVERLKSTGNKLAEGATYEMTGPVVGKVVGGAINKVIAPFSKRLTQVDGIFGDRVLKSEVKRIKELYAKYGQDPLPSEIIGASGAGSKTLGILESVLGYAPISGDVMLKRTVQRLNFMNDLRTRMIERGGTPRELEQVGRTIRNEVGELFKKYTGLKGDKLQAVANNFLSQLGSDLGRYETGVGFKSLLENKLKSSKATVKSLYEGAARLLGGEGTMVPVSTQTSSVADKLFQRELKIPSGHKSSKILEKLRPFITEDQLASLDKGTRTLLESNPTLKEAYFASGGGQQNALTWETAQEVRSRLLKEVGKIYRETGGMGNAESRIYTILADSIDQDMARVAQKQGGAAWKAYSAAKAAAKKQHELFDKDVLGIMNSDAEKIVNRVTKNGEVTLLKQLKAAAGDDALDPIRRTYFRKLVSDATDTNGVIDPAKIQKSLKSLTQETFNELASPQQQETIRGLIKNIGTINKKYGGMKTMEFLDIVANEPSSRVVKYLVRPENVDHIRLARRILSPTRMREVEQQTLLNVLKQSDATGNYMPVTSAKNFQKYKTVLKEMMGEHRFNNLKEFIDLGTNADKIEKLATNASQTGQVFTG